MRLAVIGGTGVDEMAGLTGGERITVATRFGSVTVIAAELGGRSLVFVPRHGIGHSLAPSSINYRGQIAALHKIGVTRVIGVCAVGSLTRSLPAGSFAVLNDFIDLTRHRPVTFYDDATGPVVHTDFTRPYCPQVRESLVSACSDAGVSCEPGAVYVGVDGPRYETPAEIRLYASWGGHVIGMTNVPEVILAREAGLCYGALAIVSNLAAGLSPGPLSHDEVRSAVKSAGESLSSILGRAIESIPNECRCGCKSSVPVVEDRLFDQE